MKKSPQIKSLNKGISILELFEYKSLLSITEISHALNLSMSVTYKIVNTFAYNGFLSQISESKKYEIGPRAFIIGSLYIKNNTTTNRIVSNAYPILQDLMQKTGCTAQIGTLDKQIMQAIIIASVESEGIVRISASLGEAVPLHAAAAGKIILAYNNEIMEEVLKHPLIALTKYTIVDKDLLRREIAAIKSLGYAVNKSEWYEGVYAIACPLLNHINNCIGSILISFPIIDDSREITPLVDILKKAAKELSQKMGYFED